MVLLGGRDAADLLDQLSRWTEADGFPTAAPDAGPARLAVVAPNAKRLELARRVLERGTAFRGRNDVWFEPEGMVAAGGKVAFVFPGVEPVFDPQADDVFAHFGLAPVEIAEGAPPLQHQSLGIIHLGRTLATALDRLGIRPDLMAGHSLGEWTGQIASGMIPADYIDDFLERLHPGSIEVSDVVFLALGCGADVAAEIVEGIPDASVSHDNCPHQSVICGTPAAIEQAMARVKEHKVMGQELPFRSGFHSPLFAPFVGGLAEQFHDLTLVPPRVPLWSATTCAPYPDGHDEIADLAVRHLVEPVRFQGLVRRLHDEGVRVFLQVGTGSLGGFIDDTLRDEEFLAMSANVAKQTGLGQLRRVAAALWVQGVPVDLAALSPDPSRNWRDDPRQEEVPEPSSRSSRPLPMGSELIRDLTPLDLGGRTIGAGPIPAGATPLLAEFHGALDDAAEAARMVTDLMGRRPGGAAPAPTIVAPSTVAPEPAAEPAPANPDSIVVERSFSLAEQPYWADHAFFEQPPGWAESEDTFPLIPMTAIVEYLAEVAAELVPGQVVVAIEDIRAFKWLAVDPPTTVSIRATRDRAADEARADGTVTVKASIDKHARAVVRFAPAYPAAPAPSMAEIVGEVPVTVDHVGVYTERHLFHGPEYQGLRSFDHFGTNGARAMLESLPAPGSLLDNAGQVFGYWVACAVEKDRLVLPTSLDRIAYFGPHPEPGTMVECIVNITHMDPTTARCDLELTVDGRLWVRIEGWEDRRFHTDDRLFTMYRNPRLLVGEPQAGGWTLSTERWNDSASRDVVMRRYLGKAEREIFEGFNPNVQRQWLLGRVAAKDAVRNHLYEAGSGPLFPAQVQVVNDDAGKPLLRSVGGGFDADLRVSLAHTAGIGVAIVAEGTDVGIDVERVEPRAPMFAATTLTEAEQELLGLASLADGDPARDRILTRAWAAKEAAAKAAGTGMQGRPKDFAIAELAGTRLRIGSRWIATETIMVSPPVVTDADQTKEHIVAWTITDL